MVLHVVLFKPRADVDDSALGELANALAALPSKIPGIVDFTWGSNSSPEGLGRGYEYGFVMTFESIEARDRYLPHPAHEAVLPLVRAVTSEALVFDLER